MFQKLYFVQWHFPTSTLLVTKIQHVASANNLSSVYQELATCSPNPGTAVDKERSLTLRPGPRGLLDEGQDGKDVARHPVVRPACVLVLHHLYTIQC